MAIVNDYVHLFILPLIDRPFSQLLETSLPSPIFPSIIKTRNRKYILPFILLFWSLYINRSRVRIPTDELNVCIPIPLFCAHRAIIMISTWRNFTADRTRREIKIETLEGGDRAEGRAERGGKGKTEKERRNEFLCRTRAASPSSSHGQSHTFARANASSGQVGLLTRTATYIQASM